MGKHLALVGAGHAHMTTLLRLRDFTGRGHRVTVVSSSPYHYYSGMGPGMLSGMYRPEEIRFHIEKMARERDADFVEDTVIRTDPDRCSLFLASGRNIQYDIASFNTGSVVKNISDGNIENAFRVKPIRNLLDARQSVLDLRGNAASKVLIVGGGPAGVELAGNVQQLIDEQKLEAKVTLVSGSALLPASPARARILAMKSLTRRRVEIVENTIIERLEPERIRCKDGRTFAFDVLLLAVGIEPPRLFRESGLPVGDAGGLLVNSFLQSVKYPNIFGGGDCISFQLRPLDKVGVHAVRQNPILHNNLRAALENGRMRPFKPQAAYLLIFNLGDGTGIFCRKNWVWNGKLAFRLKDYLDRAFMRKFQVSGERE